MQKEEKIDLDNLVTDLSAGGSLVERWLSEANAKSRLPQTNNRGQTATEVQSSGRPPRLGIGAKTPKEKGGQGLAGSDNIFANYELKMKLTGRETLGNGKDNMILKPKTHIKPSQPATKVSMKNNDDDEDSRAKSLGKSKVSLNPVPLSSGNKKRKKNKNDD